MLADFEEAKIALQHSGQKGDRNEEIVKSFLRKYLPRNLEISSEILVDSHGGISRQLDIIIHDAAKTPIFYQDMKNKVIPVECAYAIFEVKAKLTKEELEKSFKNIQSVKIECKNRV